MVALLANVCVNNLIVCMALKTTQPALDQSVGVTCLFIGVPLKHGVANLYKQLISINTLIGLIRSDDAQNVPN